MLYLVTGNNAAGDQEQLAVECSALISVCGYLIFKASRFVVKLLHWKLFSWLLGRKSVKCVICSEVSRRRSEQVLYLYLIHTHLTGLWVGVLWGQVWVCLLACGCIGVKY